LSFFCHVFRTEGSSVVPRRHGDYFFFFGRRSPHQLALDPPVADWIFSTTSFSLPPIFLCPAATVWMECLYVSVLLRFFCPVTPPFFFAFFTRLRIVDSLALSVPWFRLSREVGVFFFLVPLFEMNEVYFRTLGFLRFF